MGAWQKTIIGIAILLATALIVTCASVCWLVRGEKFDSSLWQKDVSRRYAMTNNLTRKERLIGMTADQICALLGKPDTVKRTDGNSSSSCIWSYRLDNDDNSWLDLSLSNPKGDNSRIVVKSFQVRLAVNT